MTTTQIELLPTNEGGFRLITETQEDGDRITAERDAMNAVHEQRERNQVKLAIVSEIKCSTVREVACNASAKTPNEAAQLWNKTVATANWFQEDKEHVVVFMLDSRNNVGPCHRAGRI